MAVGGCLACVSPAFLPFTVVGLTAIGVNNTMKKSKKKKSQKKTISKKKSKTQKGGSGYETQMEIDEQNRFFEEEFRREREYSKKRKKEMRKECSDLLLTIKGKMTPNEERKLAELMFIEKNRCDKGHLSSCNYCKEMEQIINSQSIQKRKSRSKSKRKHKHRSKSRSKSKSKSRSRSRSRST
tara:strand:- start:3141 stop:3689 length:549 start_codon:yes stop_codon:yes gene_type:complete